MAAPARRERELLLVRWCVDASVKEIDEHRLNVRLDYVNEQLQVLAERELGYRGRQPKSFGASGLGSCRKKTGVPAGSLWPSRTR